MCAGRCLCHVFICPLSVTRAGTHTPQRQIHVHAIMRDSATQTEIHAHTETHAHADTNTQVKHAQVDTHIHTQTHSGARAHAHTRKLILPKGCELKHYRTQTRTHHHWLESAHDLFCTGSKRAKRNGRQTSIPGSGPAVLRLHAIYWATRTFS